jgi:hypothetical protein
VSDALRTPTPRNARVTEHALDVAENVASTFERLWYCSRESELPYRPSARRLDADGSQFQSPSSIALLKLRHQGVRAHRRHHVSPDTHPRSSMSRRTDTPGGVRPGDARTAGTVGTHTPQDRPTPKAAGPRC